MIVARENVIRAEAQGCFCGDLRLTNNKQAAPVGKAKISVMLQKRESVHGSFGRLWEGRAQLGGSQAFLPLQAKSSDFATTARLHRPCFESAGGTHSDELPPRLWRLLRGEPLHLTPEQLRTWQKA